MSAGAVAFIHVLLRLAPEGRLGVRQLAAALGRAESPDWLAAKRQSEFRPAFQGRYLCAKEIRVAADREKNGGTSSESW